MTVLSIMKQWQKNKQTRSYGLDVESCKDGKYHMYMYPNNIAGYILNEKPEGCVFVFIF